MNKMTGGQLVQIYNIATQQGCDHDKIQFLFEKGFMTDFLAGDWSVVDRSEFRQLAGLIPNPTHTGRTLVFGGETKQTLLKKLEEAGISELSSYLDFPLREEYLEPQRREVKLKFFSMSWTQIRMIWPCQTVSYESIGKYFVERYDVDCLTSEMMLKLRLDTLNQPLWPGGAENWYAPQLPDSMQPNDKAHVGTQGYFWKTKFESRFDQNPQGGETFVFVERRK